MTVREWLQEKLIPVAWLFLAAVIVGAEVGTAIAHADPQQDATFLALASRHGMSWQSADSAIAQGHAVCQELWAGKPLLEVAEDAYQFTRLTSRDMAATFVAISVTVFCPEFGVGRGEMQA
jgi:hypothetical protein